LVHSPSGMPIAKFGEHEGRTDLDIRFVSSLTSDDEDRLAPAVASVLGNILDLLGIAYTLHVDTNGDSVVRHSRPNTTESAAAPVSIDSAASFTP